MNKTLLTPNIQLFAEGNTEPDGGEGNANQNGGNNTSTYTTEQLNSIVDERVGRAEQAALKSFFSQQGMSEQEITQAINSYKEQKKQNTPDINALQTQTQQAQQQAQQAAISQQATLEAVKMGISASTIPYVLKLADFTAVTGQDGKIDEKKLKEAIDKVLDDVPSLKSTQEQNNNGFKIGGNGNSGQANSDEDVLRNIFGIKQK